MNILIFCVFSLVPFQNAAVHEANVTVCPDYADILRFKNELAFPKMLYPMEEAEPLPAGTELPELPELPAVQEVAEKLPEPENVSEPLPETLPETLPEPVLESEREPEPALVGSALEPEGKPEENTEVVDAVAELPALEPEIVSEVEVDAEAEKAEMKLELALVPKTEPKPGVMGEGDWSQDPYWTAKQEAPQSVITQEPERLEMPKQVAMIPTQVPTQNSVTLVTAQEPVTGNGVLSDEPIRRPWGVLTFCVFILLLSVSANVFLGWQLIEMRSAKLK